MEIQENGIQMNESSRRNSRRTLTKPDVASPASYAFPGNRVKPIEYPEEEMTVPNRNFVTFIIIGAVWGVISGILLLILDSENNLMYQLGDSVGAHCLIWGGIVGALYGLCLSPLYTKLHNALPAYALLLFFPTIFFLLTMPLMALSNALLELGKFLLGLLGVVVVIGIVWAWLTN